MPRTHRISQYGLLILLSLFARQASLRAQTSNPSTQTAGAQSGPSSVEVTGRVLNARTNQPVARALVRLNGRAVLTERDGGFSFPQVTGSGSLSVTKPGFYASTETDGEASVLYSFGANDPIVLMLYPEAILSGTVTDATGEGVPQLSVVARRSVFDDMGHHWQPVPPTQTDQEGSFRLTLRPGDYALEVSSSQRALAGDQVTLPLSVPTDSSSTAELIHIASGDDLPLRLRVESRKVHRIEFAMTASGRRGFPRLTARGSDGLAFPLNPLPSHNDSGTFSVGLPSGTYSIDGLLQSPEGTEEASTTITVPEHDLTGVVLNFAKTPILPVELNIDSSSSSDNNTAPSANSLGITLTALGAGSPRQEQAASLITTRDHLPAFSLPTGTYRFRVRPGGAWVITEATCNGSNLLTQNLTVAAGMGGAPIRLTVSDATASLSGTVQLGNRPSSAWIYLVATTPSATPVVSFQTGSTGSFSRKYVSPGSYRVVALAHKVSANFESPATMNMFLDRVQTLALPAGGQQMINLDVVPAANLP